MESEEVSNDIKKLTYQVVKIMVGRAGRDLNTPLKFIEVYKEACRKPVISNDGYDESHIEMRQHVRDSLSSNGHIIVDSVDVDSIHITQKAIDEYSDY
ncbi:MAG TPA: hypothetical protein VD815_08545 [Candidatus Saccharimonadales bacterium]|nr:hypothetical protein [Candidatus Saccharimonadales bacterium]